MPYFGPTSLGRLGTCDQRLQDLFLEVVGHRDCTVLIGHRTEAQQMAAYHARPQRSKVKWPNSKHNTYPSKAVDVAPWPTVWPDRVSDPHERELTWREWYMFVGLVRGIAIEMNIPIRCGADWDGDYEIKDQNFHDLPHFELGDS